MAVRDIWSAPDHSLLEAKAKLGRRPVGVWPDCSLESLIVAALLSCERPLYGRTQTSPPGAEQIPERVGA